MTMMPDLPQPNQPIDLSKFKEPQIDDLSDQILAGSQDKIAKGQHVNPLSRDMIEDQLTQMKAAGIKLTPSILNMLEMGIPILTPPEKFDKNNLALFVVTKSRNEFDPTQTKYNLWFNPNAMVAFVTTFYEVMRMMQQGKEQEAKLEIQQLTQFWDIAKEQGRIAYEIAHDQADMLKADAFSAIVQGCASALVGLYAARGRVYGAQAHPILVQMRGQMLTGIAEIIKGTKDLEKASIQVHMGTLEQSKALLDALSKTTEQQWQNAASAWRAYTEQWSAVVDLLVKMTDALYKAASMTP